MYVSNNLEEENDFERSLTTNYCIQEDRRRQNTALKRRKIDTTRQKQHTEAEQAKGL